MGLSRGYDTVPNLSLSIASAESQMQAHWVQPQSIEGYALRVYYAVMHKLSTYWISYFTTILLAMKAKLCFTLSAVGLSVFGKGLDFRTKRPSPAN